MDEYHWHTANKEPKHNSEDKKIAESLRFVVCDSVYNNPSYRPGELVGSLLKSYTELIKNSGELGINNYAGVILPLIEMKRNGKYNESDEWKSSLDFSSFASDLLKKSGHGSSSPVIKIPHELANSVVSENKTNILSDTSSKVNAMTAPASKSTFYSKLKPVPQLTSSVPASITHSDVMAVTPQVHVHDDIDADEPSSIPSFDSFRTAKEQMAINNAIKNKQPIHANSFGQSKKSLGPRRGNGKFIPPVQQDNTDLNEKGPSLIQTVSKKVFGGDLQNKSGRVDSQQKQDGDDLVLPDELSHLDPKIVELIMNEIMDTSAPLSWSDIAGLEFAKKTIKEIIVLPMLRPDIFTGLRGPPKGLLLFGPPGTGKTLIGKCIASQSKCTFFSISASSLTSKWVGEGEKMVRALFSVARYKQPSVVFIDEIDSLLTQRSESEHESSRRIKTEFLVQMDGVGCSNEDRILIIGATNRPQELDEAARRRFVKRLYIPLPESDARCAIVNNLMSSQKFQLSAADLESIVTLTDGYSGADMTHLCKEAALGPVRDIAFEDIETVTLDQVRSICYRDFKSALKQVRASVADSDLNSYLQWNLHFGSWDIPSNK